MKKPIAVGSALAIIALTVYVMAKGFGSNPHEVPFLLSGKPAPAFTIKRLDNDQPVSFSDFKGKPLVINFWATWCGPCQTEHPVLDWAAKKYEGQAVFLGIVFEDNEQNTKRFLAQNGWSFVQLFDPKSTVAVDYGVSGVPETYFIDRNGIINHKVAAPFVDPREFAAHMETILK
ncbi:MAG: TlpA family protein disulfide reductase [Myxococcales bacterium]|nr:TlpA family protein disulfide reductase [Myxococcales bacterium]